MDGPAFPMTTARRIAIRLAARLAGSLCAAGFACLSHAAGEETWAFEPERDSFDEASLLDLRDLNEPVAGESGWITATADGGFARGDGESIRFWAVNTTVEREKPYNTTRHDPNWLPEPRIGHHARWLAKRG